MENDNVRIKMIVSKERLNNVCQVSKYRSPIHSFVWHHKQRIPTIIIGSVTFSAKNWAIDDNQKVITLVDSVTNMLNDNRFVEQHADLLSADYFDFKEVFNLDNDRTITITTTKVTK